MRIIVTASVFGDPKWFPILDIVLLLVEDQRHAFAGEALHELLSSLWLKKRPQDSHDLVRLSATARSYDDLSDKSAVIIDASCRRGGELCHDAVGTKVHPLDAIIFLSMPFQVVVENELFDGGFLLWTSKAIGFEKFLAAYRKGRFIFRHAGGKDWIPKSAAAFCKGIWSRRDGRYDRAYRHWLCVVMDRDSRYPGHAPNTRIAEDAKPFATFVYQLRRRCIESYIPPAKLLLLNRSAAFSDKVNALRRLTPEQRLHYDMKCGFRTAGTPVSKSEFMNAGEISADEKSLFASVIEPDWALLKDGFGKIAHIYTEENYRPNLNDNAFTDQSDRSEMKELLEKIYGRI